MKSIRFFKNVRVRFLTIPRIAKSAKKNLDKTVETPAKRPLSPQKEKSTKTLDILIINCYNDFTYYY